MRLKCIKLAGFKSFVDPTTVSFPSNLAAVVGPNGCGKSNIIDAVRWVMGESSAKNLRGESMTDVIFNGSVNRKEVGQASIELVFDNSEGKLGGEYAAFGEIAIKRKVTREGTSEYFLNGTKCRRRDITDIFLGTGLGPRSYAIIEQGMISRLIEAKPEELRIFIEEAAGISKYKERRRETENRMRRTRENLERLTDLREEMERQLSHLERQARAAEKYKEFKAEERQLKAQLQALQWRGINDKVETRAASIRDLEVEVEAVVTERQSIETDSEKQRDNLTQLNDALNKVQGRYYSIGAEVSRIEQAIKHQQDRGRQLAEDLERINRDYDEAQSHLTGDSEKVERWQEELESITPELEMSQAQEEESLMALTEAEESHSEWQQRWDEFNQNAATPRQQAEVQQSRIQHLELTLQRLQDKMQKMEAESESLVASDEDSDIEVLREQLAEMELQGEERQQQLDEILPQIAEGRDSLQQLNDEQNALRSDLQTMKGRRASLEALQQAAMGQGEAVSNWLRDHDLEQAPLAAEQLDVESGWELAVETVLGDRLQAVCVAAIDDLAGSLASVGKGQLTLVESAGASAGGRSLASKLRNTDAALAAQLAHVDTAESLEDALARRKLLQPGQSLITREGLWVGPNWVRVARPDDSEQGVLKRQQELAELIDSIAAAEEKLASIDQQLRSRREQIADQEARRDQLQRDIQQHSRQHSELNSKLSAHQARIEQINSRRSSLRNELEEQRAQYKQEQESLGEARAVLSEAIEAMERDSGQREELMRERDELRARLDQARQKARHDKDHAHQLAMRSQSLSAQLESVAQAIARANDQVALLEKRRAEIQESLAQSGEPIEEMKLELEERLEQRLVVEEELQEARRSVDGVDHVMRELDRRRNEVENRLQQARSRLEQARLENQELQVRRRTLQEQLAEAQHDLDQVLATLPEGASEQEWQAQLEQIGKRIDRLGAINLAAIEEYDSQSERKRYLDAQNDDLEEALETLEGAIRRIDKETRNRFKETFDQVNTGLQALFPKVFGGGSAYLEMTGDDLLDTGIAIMARPPGKKNSTIHLLSGGEKALTAIALVFSIFRLNPAPFCMLDEVDAPLDDANVGRYARMVQEMSDQVQFIYITHNKIAMEMAEQLMGVTMHEPGVSRLVSVDLEEAAEMAAM
ncbi:chromosome segregation protein SMC [Litorivivens sp.]|uniref:chromosome segregation protein SMC n=1 Tax=Litorivivens sp. TaxID=2020868 RepID=UPI00356ACE2F